MTRDTAIPFLANVCVAEITTTARGLPTEVAVGERQGLAHDSVVNCDNLNTVSKGRCEVVAGRSAQRSYSTCALR